MSPAPPDPAVTYIVQLTPSGRAAIASVLVDGPRAIDVVGHCFRAANRRPLGEQPSQRILFGRWVNRDVGEEVVVCRRDSSRVEIHCHGGRAAVMAIIESIANLGCTLLDWRDHLQRTHDDPLAADAYEALAAAPTRRTASILLDQYRGALRTALNEIQVLIDHSQTDAASNKIAAVLQYAALGRHLTTPWRVVFAGRPNVGKSSLINAVVGFARSIVFDQPGTTRDVVTVTTAINGWSVELTDTAGLRFAGDATTDPLEAAGMARAADALQTADLVVLVHDATAPQLDDDRLLQLAEFDNTRTLQVVNKIDLVDVAKHDVLPPDVLRTSATCGTGVQELVAALATCLVPNIPPSGTAVPFTAEHVADLCTLRHQLHR